MNESKFMKKKQSNSLNQVQKYLIHFTLRVMFTIVFVLLLLIGFKMNKDFKMTFNEQVYHQNFPFSEVKEVDQKYFGESFSFKGLVEEEKEVFSEKISYKSKNLYQDGVMLEVSSHYMVPSLESGIIVFIGEKENYGKTVIVQQVNGVDAWYGNIELSGVKLYDYIEKGKLLGEALDKKLYLAFQKEGQFVDYQQYLS